MTARRIMKKGSTFKRMTPFFKYILLNLKSCFNCKPRLKLKYMKLTFNLIFCIMGALDKAQNHYNILDFMKSGLHEVPLIFKKALENQNKISTASPKINSQR